MEIHKKSVKFEDSCGNFHRYNDRVSTHLECNWKKGMETFSDKTEGFHLTYTC